MGYFVMSLYYWQAFGIDVFLFLWTPKGMTKNPKASYIKFMAVAL